MNPKVFMDPKKAASSLHTMLFRALVYFKMNLTEFYQIRLEFFLSTILNASDYEDESVGRV